MTIGQFQENINFYNLQKLCLQSCFHSTSLSEVMGYYFPLDPFSSSLDALFVVNWKEKLLMGEDSNKNSWQGHKLVSKG